MNLSVKTESTVPTNSPRLEGAMWFLVALMISGIFVANVFLPEQTNTLRLLWNLVAGLIVLSLASFTQKGRHAWSFAKDARVELRKVIWPTRQETVQSTMMIVVVVVVTALFLWGIDSVLLWAVGFVTGQRG